MKLDSQSGRRITLIALLLMFLFLPRCEPAMRRDELDCEEAVAKLKQCCPQFPSLQPDYCEYTPAKACSSDIYPAIREDGSREIRGKDCATLQSDHSCAYYAISPGRGGSKLAAVQSSSAIPSELRPAAQGELPIEAPLAERAENPEGP